MSPNLTEILFMLGLEDQIVGVTRHCNYPAEALTKRKVGTFWQPDVEAVLAVRPTLVIAEDFERQRQLTEQLNRIGCNTLTVRIESIPQLLEGIATIGRAVYRVEEAESLVNRLMTAQQEMRCRYAEGTRPKVLWVIQRQPLRVAGTKTFVNEMIEIAGGVNAIGPTMNIYPPIGAEQVIAAWPDVIIEPTDEPELLETQTRSAKAFYEAFRTIPAVKNERIYVIDGDLVSRLGPRLDQGLDAIARCVRQE
jgi:iron complex transport system substrate-binding protein